MMLWAATWTTCANDTNGEAPATSEALPDIAAPPCDGLTGPECATRVQSWIDEWLPQMRAAHDAAIDSAVTEAAAAAIRSLQPQIDGYRAEIDELRRHVADGAWMAWGAGAGGAMLGWLFHSAVQQ